MVEAKMGSNEELQNDSSIGSKIRRRNPLSHVVKTVRRKRPDPSDPAQNPEEEAGGSRLKKLTRKLAPIRSRVIIQSPTNQFEDSLDRNNSDTFGRKMSKRMLKLYG